MEKLEIESVEVVPLMVPRAESPLQRILPHRSSAGGFGVTAVWVHGKGGPSGFGYSWGITSSGLTTIATIIRDTLAPRLVGRDALAPEALWHGMWGPSSWLMRGGVATWALSIVDIACWDLLAKAAGLSLHRVLGGYRSKVPAYGSGGGRGFTDAELLAELEDYRAQGCTSFKFHIGSRNARGVQPNEEARIALLRKEVGDDFPLYVDANGSYTPSEAIEVAAMLRNYGIAWFEEPVPADSVDDLALVAARSPVPIATGENAYLRWGFRDLVSRQAAMILQPDVGVCGGVTEFRKVAALAESFNLALCNHLSHELGVSLIGSSSAGMTVEYADLLPHHLWAEPVEVVDGHLEVPDVAGHGIELAPDAKARYRLD